jgi:hypothetical protein
MSAPGTGAGVYIHGTGTSVMTVSNCFIVGNTVGVAVSAETKTNSHTPRVINNTLAWNTVGIWNGQLDPATSQSLGVNDMQIINNVIDASPPDIVRYPAPVSSFEGVSESQMLVASLSGGPVVNQCVNAWPVTYQNFGTPIGSWPPTTRTGADPGVNFAATEDLRPWIGQGVIGRTSATRAILYVNDALFVRLSVDHSPHDFRLAPLVRSIETGALAANPLVNRGVAITGTITAVNMAPLPIAVPPGPSSGGNWIDPPATIHCWDWDCEGHGNLRIDSRPGFTPGLFTDIDLGADEMGPLIMAGYIDSTRIYSHNVPNAQGITDHTRVFFLDLPTGPYTRPVFNWLIGGYQASPPIYYQWWTHVQTPVNAVPGTNYTRGNPPPNASSRWVLTDPLGPPNRSRNPFMRNLICDVSPHLVQDPHPLWATSWNQWVDVFGLGTNRVNDVYASHPWYEGVFDLVTLSGGRFDNPFLFHNPAWYPIASDNDWGAAFHRVTLGLASPPGSYFIAGQPSYLLFVLPIATFGPFGTCTPTVAGNYTVDALGVGDSGTNCPDALPWFPGLVSLGIRMNCQRSQNGVFSGNLQTFLVVTTNVQNPIDSAFWEGRSRQVGDSERVLESMRALPRALEWLRRNRER